MRTLCKHIFASAERKFNTVIPSLGGTLTLMQECFKNIRDVDKKLRLLEFYVFGNVTVRFICEHLMSDDPAGNTGESPRNPCVTMVTTGKTQCKASHCIPYWILSQSK